MRVFIPQSSFIRPSIAGRTAAAAVVLVAACAAAGALLALAGCNRSAAAGGNPGASAPLVAVTPAVARDVPVYLDEPVGKATAVESVTVQPQVTGMLIARHFVDGTDVHKGQLLFEIDPRPFQAALDQAKANLLQSKAALEYAQHDYQRYLDLRGQPAVSQEEIEQKENTVEVDQATVQGNQAAVETAQVNLDYCKIASPIDGRAGQRLVDVGNVVSTMGGTNGAATSLLTIQKLDPIYVDFTITENDLGLVQRYMKEGSVHVEAQLPQDAAAAARATAAAAPATGPTTQPAPGAEAQPGVQPVGHTTPPVPGPLQGLIAPPRLGKLIFLDNAVQDGTGTVKLRAEVPNADHHFWPGQFVNVRLVLTVQHNAVLVPNLAVQISQTGPYVYVVGDDNKAQLHPVTTGQRQGDMVVIESGVQAGDAVITSGQMTVVPGAPVTVDRGTDQANLAPNPGTAAEQLNQVKNKMNTAPAGNGAGSGAGSAS